MTQISNVALVGGGKILLGRRSSHRNTHPNCWALPGGHVEPGETPEQAARREAHEELGVVVTELVPLDPIKVSGRHGPTTYHVFAVVSWDGGAPSMFGDEHSELVWFEIDEACRLHGLALDGYPALFQTLRRALDRNT